MAEIRCPQCGTVISLEQSDLDSVVRQVRDEEFRREVEERAGLLEAEKKSAVELAKSQAKSEASERVSQLEAELVKVSTAKDAEIEQLKGQLGAQAELFGSQRELAVSKAVSAIEKERDELASAIKLQKAESERAEATRNEQFAEQLKAKDDVIAFQQQEIERMKDMKARLSTKMVGESLEQHCLYEFDRIRSVAFPHAYFEKDNDSSQGTKGDFIFREEDEDGNEILSIMFEMKNEEDTSSTKKRNEDHFAKLDKDRAKKGCEYAILVSLLEPDNELYNEGIVDVSHRYPKMYVVRPQFFIPIISLLRNAALGSLQYKRELAIMKRQELDITTFEQDLDEFKTRFFRSFELAGDRFEDAIEGIDKTIKLLEKIKDNLTKSEAHLTTANRRLEDLTVKKLVRKNPTMKERFAELAQAEEGDAHRHMRPGPA